MNPRHRRLVIPVALVVLLALVVIALGVAMTESLTRALDDLRAWLLDDETLVAASPPVAARPRRPAVAPRRAALRRRQGRSPAPADVLRRDAGAHEQPRAGSGRRGRRRRAARRAVRQLARRDHRRRCTSCGSPRRVTRCVHTRRGRGVARRRATARPGQASGSLAGGRPAAGGARHRRRGGPAQAEPVGEVPPGRGVRPAARRRPHRRPRQGTPAPTHRRRPAAGGRPRVRQRLPDLRRPPVPRRGPRSSGALTGVDTKEQSRDTTRRWRRRLGIRRRRSSSARIGDARGSTRRPRSCWPCTRATPPPTTRSPARSSGGAGLVLAAPCCHHDLRRQLRRRPPRRPTPP